MIHSSARSLTSLETHIEAAQVTASSEREAEARLVHFDHPEGAPAAPQIQDTRLGLASWFASSAIHTVLIVAAMAGLPFIRPATLQADGVVVDVVFAPPPLASGDISTGPDTVLPEPEIATAEPPPIEAA